MKIRAIILFSLVIGICKSQTLGTLKYSPDAMDGFTLLAPNGWDTVYLINNCGQKMHQWATSTTPGMTNFLGPDGNLYRAGKLSNPDFTAGGAGGLIESLDWNGNLNWSFTYSNSSVCQHHDIEYMPNGNVLFIAWEELPYDTCIAEGRDPNLLPTGGVWVDKIIELEPDGMWGANIVWQWNSKHHLVQDFDNTKDNFGDVSNPHKINFNFGGTSNEDWIHLNGIDYNPDLDLIAMSSPFLDEVLIIDHSTTTAEASSDSGGNFGMGGQILWRWGNPQNYGEGDSTDQKLFFQHDVQWIEDSLRFGGQIMIFNNRNTDGVNTTSTVDILSPTISGNTFEMNAQNQFLPDTLSYQYRLTPELSSIRISGAQMQENGNILICSGQVSNLIEVNDEDSISWQYECPLSPQAGILTQGDTNSIRGKIFQAFKYPTNYSGFNGQSLTAGNHIELNPIPCAVGVSENEIKLEIYPNPTEDFLNIRFENPEPHNIEIYTVEGRRIGQKTIIGQGPIDLSSMKPGIYILNIISDNSKRTVKVIKE